MRLDKYLKVSRLIKRRTIANEACDAGRVTVNGKVARASYDVKPEDVIEIAFGNNMLTRGDAYCFAYMFQGCTNLNYVKCLLSPSYDSVPSYFNEWLNNTASEGTFVKKVNVDWTNDTRVIPSTWTIIDAEI